MRKRSFIGLAALAALGLVLHAWAGAPASQTFVASFDWAEDDPSFGGLSAIELAEDGSSFTALSDNSTLYTGTIQRGADGHIQQIMDVTGHRLRGPDGLLLDAIHDDSEGLAMGADGAYYVSQEGPARVLRLAGPDASAEIQPQHPDFANLQMNSALEALAIDPSGAIYTLPERSGTLDRPFPVYRLADGRWTTPFTITRIGAYLPTAADFGPDGRLYILERNFQGFRGFQSRVRRFSMAGGAISTGETVLETHLGQHGNLEGLSVWRDATGTLRLTMVSDDNFHFFLRTSLVEYTIPD